MGLCPTPRRKEARGGPGAKTPTPSNISGTINRPASCRLNTAKEGATRNDADAATHRRITRSTTLRRNSHALATKTTTRQTTRRRKTTTQDRSAETLAVKGPRTDQRQDHLNSTTHVDQISRSVHRAHIQQGGICARSDCRSDLCRSVSSRHTFNKAESVHRLTEADQAAADAAEATEGSSTPLTPRERTETRFSDACSAGKTGEVRGTAPHGCRYLAAN